MKVIHSRTAAVIAGAAVLATLGGIGGAYAGDLVRSPEIADNTIRKIDVAKGAIAKGELRSGSVAKIEIRKDAVAQGEIRDGAVGFGELTEELRNEINSHAKADHEHEATPGLPGADGVSGYEVHNREARLTDETATVTVSCPEGKVALGGGYVVESIRGGAGSVSANQPVYDAATGTATGWAVTATATGNVNVKSWVTCALAS